MEQVGQISLEYAGGFFDGEGCFHIGRTNSGYYNAVAKITQKHPLVPDMFCERWGGRVHYNKAWDGYQWHLGNKELLFKFLDDIQDHLIIKHDQATVFRDFLRLRKGHKYNPLTELDINNREKLRTMLTTMHKAG